MVMNLPQARRLPEPSTFAAHHAAEVKAKEAERLKAERLKEQEVAAEAEARRKEEVAARKLQAITRKIKQRKKDKRERQDRNIMLHGNPMSRREQQNALDENETYSYEIELYNAAHNWLKQEYYIIRNYKKLNNQKLKEEKERLEILKANAEALGINDKIQAIKIVKDSKLKTAEVTRNHGLVNIMIDEVLQHNN